MNLVIDEGNTTVKVAMFDGERLLEANTYRSTNIEDIDTLISEGGVTACIYSSVAEYNQLFISRIRERLNKFLYLSFKTPVPLNIRYATPETLGMDRVAGAVGARVCRPNADILVIDAGTAITYDFVNSDGDYNGGNISPGIAMRFSALNRYTKHLPLIKESDTYPEIGYDTSSAILSGVMGGLKMEVLGYIDAFYNKNPDITVIITGGDHAILCKILKDASPVSINCQEHLVLRGLNRILNYNVYK